jgi:tetratricopeptide (TPR) repeat protein/DNA-binding SARP family transcriptional activator
MVEFRLLGDVDVWHAGRRVALGSKQRAVLAVLAFHANTVVSRTDLVRLVWGGSVDDPPVTIDRLVTDYVSRLRTAFRLAGVGDAARLVARPPGYLLEADPAGVDWHRFRNLVNGARAAQLAADHAEAADLLRRGLALWRGPALADLADMSLDPLRAQMSDLRLVAAEDLAAAELAVGRGGEVVGLLADLAARHPGRERMAALLIRSLHAAGRRDDAMTVYQRTLAHLTSRLGLDPTDVLDDAYRAVLHGRAPTPARSEDHGRLAQLPADTANFTGRRAELAHLLAPISDTADGPGPGGVVEICAVDGMGGIGKTTLAVHAAHRLAARFPDGCLFLDLHGYTHTIAPVEPGQALERLLRALGLPGEQIPDNVDDQAALYRSRLAGRSMLIVLDNARTAEQVRPLLPAEPRCLVLITSRRRLTALDEARPLSLDILPLADAVTLFSRIAGPGRTAGHSDAVRRVVELCGRLPLAIRIAAARLRARSAWSVATVADRLADRHLRLGELDDGERGVAAAFALSYHDLTSEQQRAFRHLGLHPGADTDPYAAAALTGLSLTHTGRVLEDLLDSHLLVQAVSGRYRLHDLMRAYAANLARTQDSDGARRVALTNLFDHYLGTAAAAMGALYPVERHPRPRIPPADSPKLPVSDTAGARVWLDAERPNLVAAIAHTATHGWPTHTTSLSATLCDYFYYGSHHAEALTIHTHARSAARHIGDWAAEAYALTNLGYAHDGVGRHAQGADHLRQAISLFRELGDRAGEARALTTLGMVNWRPGHHKQAADHLQEGLTLFRELGDRGGEASALENLGLIYIRQGRYNEGTEQIYKALAHHRDVGDRYSEAWALDALGAAHLSQGRYEQAATDLQGSLTLSRDIGDRAAEGYALKDLGLVYQRQRLYDEAADHHQRAIALFREIGDRTGETEALNSLGETLHASGRPDKARDQHTTALALTIQTSHRVEQARAHTGLAHTHYVNHEYDQARHHWREALAIYTDVDMPEVDVVRAYLAALDQAAADKQH